MYKDSQTIPTFYEKIFLTWLGLSTYRNTIIKCTIISLNPDVQRVSPPKSYFPEALYSIHEAISLWRIHISTDRGQIMVSPITTVKRLICLVWCQILEL